MRVRGKGTVTVQPDTAVVVVGVVTESMQLSTAQEENARRVNEVINALLGIGVPQKDIQTQSYTIEPQSLIEQPELKANFIELCQAAHLDAMFTKVRKYYESIVRKQRANEYS
jgi:hypothetical protein